VKRDERSWTDTEYFTLLVACDEALAAGLAPPISAAANLEPELRARLERGVACMRLLRRYMAGANFGDSTVPD